MPSDPLPPAAPPPGRGTAGGAAPGWLRSQGLGLACAWATVLLLGVGSFVLAAAGPGPDPPPVLDDIRPFLRRARAAHLWFYLLLPVLGLFALNTLLCTWEGLRRWWRAGRRSLAELATPLIHASFVIALLAHLLGGLASEELGVVRLDHRWRPLPDGRQARVLSLDEQWLPGGLPRSAQARLQLQGPAGELREETVGYNQPLSQGLGARLYLLLRHAQVPAEARLQLGAARCALMPGEACELGGNLVRLLSVEDRARPWAQLAVWPAGRPPPLAPALPGLAPGQGLRLPDGGDLRLTRVLRRPQVILRGRSAPGNPLALLCAALMLLGLALLSPRLLRPRRPRPGGPAPGG